MASNSNRTRAIIFFFLIFLSSLSIFLIWNGNTPKPIKNNQSIGAEEVIESYSEEIYKEAYLLGLNPEYFMALCMLECGGRRPSPSRFEKHVYRRLINLKAGKRTHYEKVTIETLKDANESAIKTWPAAGDPFKLWAIKLFKKVYSLKICAGPQR